MMDIFEEIKARFDELIASGVDRRAAIETAVNEQFERQLEDIHKANAELLRLDTPAKLTSN